MSEVTERIEKFVEDCRRLKGDEKGEAQTFLNWLFQAFGHESAIHAGAVMEDRIKRKDRGTSFADLVWRPRVLIEMKKRGEKLSTHYTQARDYWLEMRDKPKYVVLCNFDEFVIYDMLHQMDDPIDRVTVAELPKRQLCLNFLLPIEKAPIFGNDRVAVTRAAADQVAQVFHSMVLGRKPADRIERTVAQRFILQCVTALFAEDIDLFQRRGLFTELILRCKDGEESSYDAFGALFNQMNSKTPAKGGRFKDVPYFNGGLFANVEPVELNADELTLLAAAANEDWSMVKPPIFGTLFEGSMDQAERHAFGAHFTSEIDILKVVLPTIVRPWKERLEAAGTLKDLRALRKEMLSFAVLDPACGSGNFLYVAYREMKRIEMELLAKVHKEFGKRAQEAVGTTSLVSTRQFYGIDIKPFAVELAKLTVMLAKKLAMDEGHDYFEANQVVMPWAFDKALPLDNLDQNIICEDALFSEWPKAQAIIGNPPYQSKNKMQQELGPDYVQKVRARFPEVPGRADYCVYWFRRAHDELPSEGRAGLVGTNTIRQNYSREGGLDYIVGNRGTITEAVSSQVWSGDAVVHVSIVNWVKGETEGKKKLHFQLGDDRDSPWKTVELDVINSSLSQTIDLTSALPLACNGERKTCFQGQTHGHEGFLLTPDEAQGYISTNSINGEILFPYLTADEMIGIPNALPTRFVIDFHPRTVIEAAKYKGPFEHVKATVLVTREESAKEEESRNAKALADNPKAKVNHHHRNFLSQWWLLSYPRQDMVQVISKLPRFISCGQVTKRPIFDFIHSEIRPNAALMVFSFADDYSFGVLQSGLHWAWFTKRCSTLKGDFRYTSNTVYDTFPWPQAPSLGNVRKVAKAAVELRALRRKIMMDNGWSLRELYRTLETPGKNPLRDAQDTLDSAVRAAYDMKPKEDPLAFLLKLNHDIANAVFPVKKITAPGLPLCVDDPQEFITDDCVRMKQQ